MQLPEGEWAASNYYCGIKIWTQTVLPPKPKGCRAQLRQPTCTARTSNLPSHPSASRPSQRLCYSPASGSDVHWLWPQYQMTLIFPFPSLTTPLYTSWRNTPFTACFFQASLQRRGPAFPLSSPPSSSLRAFLPSLRGLRFALSSLIYLLRDRIMWDRRPRKPHAAYVA